MFNNISFKIENHLVENDEDLEVLSQTKVFEVSYGIFRIKYYCIHLGHKPSYTSLELKNRF